MDIYDIYSREASRAAPLESRPRPPRGCCGSRSRGLAASLRSSVPVSASGLQSASSGQSAKPRTWRTASGPDCPAKLGEASGLAPARAARTGNHGGAIGLGKTAPERPRIKREAASGRWRGEGRNAGLPPSALQIGEGPMAKAPRGFRRAGPVTRRPYGYRAGRTRQNSGRPIDTALVRGRIGLQCTVADCSPPLAFDGCPRRGLGAIRPKARDRYSELHASE